MPAFHCDFETTSAAILVGPKSVGGYRYAADSSTRILLMAMAKEDGTPVVWRFNEPDHPESRQAIELLEEAIDLNDLIYAHNAPFEIAISRYRMLTDLQVGALPQLSQWRCTQAMCNRAAIPPSLDAASSYLGITNKDKIGKALIGIFSDQNAKVSLEPPDGMKDPDTVKQKANGTFTAGRKPKNRTSTSPILDEEVLWDWKVKVAGVKMTVREAWDRFIEYCRQDVVVEQALHKKLSRFELTGDELASFQFDLEMNYRGVPVNQQALKNAWKLVRQYQDRLEVRFKNLCGLTSSQGKALLPWLAKEGYKGENLQADTVSTALDAPEGITPLGLEVLKLRSLLSFAAIKKIPKMLEAVCPNGRVCGTTQWHGARTGRATGRIIQPQNMKKATISDSELAYSMLSEGAPLEDFEELWSSFLEVVSSCARHFIHDPEGDMLDVDFVGVEARITPWLCGDERKLQSIIDGVDQYKSAASKVYKVAYDMVIKTQRSVGKVAELACCFGVGGKGLLAGMQQNGINDITLKECREIVKIWRENHPATVDCWKEIENAAKAAIRDGTTTQVADGRLAFGRIKTAGIVYLVMRLPSGRRMYYPEPKLKNVFKKYDEEEMLEDPWKREKGGYWIEQISFYGKVENGGMWGRVYTWGSRLFENAVQATGADLLNYGCIEATRDGYEILMIVHDQALARANKPLAGFMEAICRKQPWAETFPLEADGAIVPFYLKN